MAPLQQEGGAGHCSSSAETPRLEAGDSWELRKLRASYRDAPAFRE